MDKTPSLADLEYFSMVVAQGSITGAAKELRVQQSTVSIAIQRLESILGTSLLVRTRQGIEPTRAGRLFIEKAQSLLESWGELSRAISGSGKSYRTRFSLGCHQSTGLYTLKKFFPLLLKQHPYFEVTVHHDYAPNIIESVLSYRLDFGFAVNPVRHEDLKILPLYKTYLAVWSSARSEKDNPDVLLYDPHMHGLPIVFEHLEEADRKFKRKLMVSSLDTIASLVISGAGFGILPADTACSLGASPLKLFWEPNKVAPLTVCLVYRKDSQQSEAAKHFIEIITNELGKLEPGRKHREK